MMLQRLRPVTPLIPNRPEKMKPPTAAPRSNIRPEPVLLTILLATKPAISPRMIQLITPMLIPPNLVAPPTTRPLRSCSPFLVTLCRGAPSGRRLRQHSEMLGAALPGVVPDLVPVLVEDQRRIGLRNSPGPQFDLAFELARSPAGVAEGHEDFGRPFLGANVPQYIEARRHGNPIVYSDGLRPM